MKNRITHLIIITAFATSCSLKQENERLYAALDSLSSAIELQKQTATALENVGVLLDSIDASRGIVTVKRESDFAFDTYSARLIQINDYVKTSEAKLREMQELLAKKETDLALANAAIRANTNTIGRLRDYAFEKSRELRGRHR